jgi:hypothetical protein
MKTFLIVPFAILLTATLGIAKTGPRALPRSLPPPISRVQLKHSSHTISQFFGWRFAALYHQDTSRWQRPQGLASPLTLKNETLKSLRVGTVHGASPATSTSSTPGGFLQHAMLPSGYIPTASVQGDFNEDGKMDLAISNGGDGTIYVFLGNGDDTFQLPEVIYTSGPSPVWMTSTSLRNNGHFDLIVADGDNGSIETLLGKGDGTFQHGTTIPLPQIPTYLVAGDFNKDGNVDIAVAESIAAGAVGPQFQVFFGDGSGNFPTSVSSPLLDNSGSETPIVTTALSAGDLNNDGYLDVIASIQLDYLDIGGGVPGFASTYLSQNATAFMQTNTLIPNDGFLAVTLADMNEDGCLDAIESGGWGYITVALGTCDGNFTTPTNFTASAGDTAGVVTVADVNGDGHLDVVSAGVLVDGIEESGYGSTAGYLISVMLGDGKGNLAAASVYPASTDMFSLTATDLNGDNMPEIVALGSDYSMAFLFQNDGAGSFGSPQGETIGYLQGVTNAAHEQSTPIVTDLNGDGKADILLMESGQEGDLPNQATALLSDGKGNFLPPVRSTVSVGTPSPYMTFATGDFRGTGRPDLIYVAEEQVPEAVGFLPGNGDGSFGTATNIGSVPDPYLIAVGDFNNDQKLDFAIYGYNNGDIPSPQSELDVFLGNGDGTFRQLSPTTFPLLVPLSAVPYQLIVGDFNHDGKPDLLIGYDVNGGESSSGDDLDLALGNGDGTFQPATTLIPHFGPVSVADLNNDGYLDLIQSRDPSHFVDSDNNIEYIVNAVTVYLGGAGASFQRQPTYLLPGITPPIDSPAITGDFNRDGILDIASIYQPNPYGGPPQLQILQGVGDGSFQLAGAPYSIPFDGYQLFAGNFRGSGLTDLFHLIQYTPSVTITPATPAAAVSIAFDSVPLLGNEGTATVTLGLPSSSSQTVTLTSSDPSVGLPSSLSFSTGERQQSFTFTLGAGFDSSHLLKFSASLAGQTATAFVAKAAATNSTAYGVTANIGGETVLNLNQISIAPGEQVNLVLNLTSVGGYSGVFEGFSCSGLPTGASCTFADTSIALAGGSVSQEAFTLQAPANFSGGPYSVVVGATNGSIDPTAPLALTAGGFGLSINPSTVIAGTPNSPYTQVTANFAGGYTEQIALTCPGLPAQATCSSPGDLGPPATGSQSQMTLTFTAPSGMTPNDYPFQIVGTTTGETQSLNAILRVVGLSGSINPSAATLTSGESAPFTVTLTSLNHFANSVALMCQSTSGVTCSSGQTNLADNGTATITLTVTYQTPSTVTIQSKRQTAIALKSTSRWLCILVLPSLIFFRRKKNALWMVFVATVCLQIGACSGGSSASGSGSGSGPSPNSQTISVPVYATSSFASGTLQQSVGTITLTVN